MTGRGLSTGRVKCSPLSGVYSHRVTKFDSTALRATSMLSALWKRQPVVQGEYTCR